MAFLIIFPIVVSLNVILFWWITKPRGNPKPPLQAQSDEQK